ncbi:MAG: type II toxin-antitoxin system prevent-host-death family antitoxin [Acidobacteriota bacterium]
MGSSAHASATLCAPQHCTPLSRSELIGQRRMPWCHSVRLAQSPPGCRFSCVDIGRGAMRQVNLRSAGAELGSLVEEVRTGCEVVLTRRGRAVARLVPPARTRRLALPSLHGLRQGMIDRGARITEGTVAAMRRDER